MAWPAAYAARILYQIPGIAQKLDICSWATAHHSKLWLLWVLFAYWVHLAGVSGGEKNNVGLG